MVCYQECVTLWHEKRVELFEGIHYVAQMIMTALINVLLTLTAINGMLEYLVCILAPFSYGLNTMAETIVNSIFAETVLNVHGLCFLPLMIMGKAIAKVRISPTKT